MSMFNDISWGSEENEQECESNAQLASIYARRFSPGKWSFLGSGSEKKWYSTHDGRPQGEWDRVAELMMIKFGESRHPVFRATSPLSPGTLKSKGGGKLSIHFCADEGTIETGFRTIVSVNQLSIYWAVSDLCEGRLVHVGQYFMPKDTEEFSQFTDSVACREYTLPRDEKSSEPKSWTTRIGPVLEITTSYLQGKYGVEIRVETFNKDNSHSWVRISHGLSKLVTDLSNKEDEDNEQETSEMKFEEFALMTNVLAFASRSKAKAKPRRRTSAHPQELYLSDIEPETYSRIAYPVSKPLSTLLRHGHLPREDDGAIEFWRLKGSLRNEFEHSQHWSDEMWKSRMAGGGGNKQRLQYCTDPSGQEILYLRALQGHSGSNPIDPSLQHNVIILSNFFQYIYHVGCAINLHSITNSGLILGGRNLGKER